MSGRWWSVLAFKAAFECYWGGGNMAFWLSGHPSIQEGVAGLPFIFQKDFKIWNWLFHLRNQMEGCEWVSGHVQVLSAHSPVHSAGDKPQAWLWSANPGLSDVLTDRVKYHDLYLSTGCCSYAVNAVLKPLYPLSEDLQYSRPHASRSALKLHYQQPSRLSITHVTPFHQKSRSEDAVQSCVFEVPRSSPLSGWHCRWLLLGNIWIY